VEDAWGERGRQVGGGRKGWGGGRRGQGPGEEEGQGEAWKSLLFTPSHVVNTEPGMTSHRRS
jgi:hypothetical protein